MQNPPRPVTGYPVPNSNGYAQNNPPPPSSAAAYPYPYYQQPPPYPNPRTTFLRRFLFFFFTGLLIIFASIIFIPHHFASIIFITWLVLRPRYPDFTLQSLSLSNYNSSAQSLTGTWTAKFQVYNPNKKLSISYINLISMVNYGHYDLTESRVPPFEQKTRNSTTMDVTLSLTNSFVDKEVVDGINKGRTSGEVKFTVKIGALVNFQYGGWRYRRRIIRVVCDDVALSGSSGKMLGGAKKCDVF